MSVLNLAAAQKIIEAALAHSKAKGYKPMGIAVLDESGQLKAFAREDGASMFRFDIARAKAWGAVGMGASSRVLAAVGASGGTGDEDEEICIAGIEAAGLMAG